jgi:hypothetical protein
VPAAVQQTATQPEAAPPTLKVQIEGQGTEKSKDGFFETIKSITDLISASAWPLVVLLLVIWYRKQIGGALNALAGRLKEAEGLEFGPLKIALSKSATLATKTPVGAEPEDQQKAIEQQTKVAQDLRDKVIQDPGVLPEIRKKMDELARQYELLRAARDQEGRKASEAEIVAMNKIVFQMRALAISCLPYWDEYAQSERPGDRLAAVVIVQMSPDPKYLDWLDVRFEVDRPFIFYHAALALQNMVDQCWTEASERIIRSVQRALKTVKAHEEPDKNTLVVLNGILKRSNR